jgi:hypothetical protein
MGALVVLMLATVTLCVVLVGAAAWIAGRAVRRLHRFAGRVVDRSVLSLKARALPPGRVRQVARLRLDLRAGIDQTAWVLDEAAREDCALGELPRLFRRVEQLARSVDAELRMVEGGIGVTRGELAAAQQRSEDLVAIAAKIRRAVGTVRADLTSDVFRSLHGEVDVEVSALRAGVAHSLRAGLQAP